MGRGKAAGMIQASDDKNDGGDCGYAWMPDGGGAGAIAGNTGSR